MREVTVKLYTVKELSRDAQERAMRFMERDGYPWDLWHNFDHIKEVGAKLGLKIKNIYFNLDRRYLAVEGSYSPYGVNPDEVPEELRHIAREISETRGPGDLWVENGWKQRGTSIVAEYAMRYFNRWALHILEKQYRSYCSFEGFVKTAEALGWEFFEDGIPAKLPAERHNPREGT